MPIPLAVLIVEDVESDAQLLVRLLKKADYELVYEQVENAEQMRAALEKRNWDIVISDYSLPQFDGRAALKMLQNTGRDIPFIVVSGTIGEEIAVSMMRAGAHDYLIKGDLARLAPAVERELGQADIRRGRKQARIALRESEDRYRTLVESSPDSICIHCEGKLVYVNAATLKLFHADRAEDMLGLPAIQFVHPDSRAIAMERVRHSYENRQSAPLLEERFITLDGNPIDVEVVTTPIEYEGKAATQLIIRDIAARKRSESALRKSKQQYDDLVSKIPIGIYILRSAPTGAFAFDYVSPKMADMLNVSVESILADPQVAFQAVHPHELDAFVKLNQEIIQLRRLFDWEGRFVIEGAVKWLHITSSPEQQENGDVLWHGLFVDITERKHAEAALAASEAELRSLVEQVPAIVYTESAETRETLYVSPQVEKLTGYTPAEWIKDRDAWKQMIYPEDLAALLAEDENTNINHEPFQIEYRILTRDGRTLWFRDEAVIIEDKHGTPLFWQGVMHNITERKQAEELASQQSKQLKLLYEASQRLNSTLDLHEIYKTICDFMSVIAPNDALSISAFDPEAQLISCRAFWMDNKWLDVSPFPAIPLEAEGKGTQSIAIRTGQSMLVNDFQALMKTAQNSYVVNGETNEVGKEAPPDEEVTRSALIVPLKIGGVVSGVIQVLSYRLNAYTEDQLKLLESLALHIASAQQNALLYAQVQTELNERKQAEESMRSANILLERTLEQSPVPMVLVSMPDGIIRSANSACMRSLGYEDEPSPIGAPLSELKVTWQDFDMQGNPATVADLPLPASLRGIKSIQERHIIRKDGTSVYGLVYGSPIFDAAGNLIAGYLVMVDITERKQAEMQLRKLSRAVDQNPVSIVITDLQGNIEYVNPKFSQVTGYGFEEALGKNPRILKSEHTTQEEYKKMWETIISGNVWQGEFLNKNKNGETYWEFATIAPVFSEDGKITNFLALKENITERKQAEESLHQRVTELEMLYQSGLALGQLLNPKEIGQKILELLQEKLEWHHTRIRLYHPEDDSLELLDFNQPGLKNKSERREAVERVKSLVTRTSQGMSGWAIQLGHLVRFGDVRKDSRYVESYPGIRSGLYVPMKLGNRIVGVISIESEQFDAFSAEDERLIVTLANQAASAFENARLFEETRQRVMELEMLYQSGLALGQLLSPEEIGQKLLELLDEKLDWHHTAIRLYDPQGESLKLIDFRQTGLASETEKYKIENHLNLSITKVGDGLTGWAVQQSSTIRSGDVVNDPHYKETVPGISSGLYVPIKLGERIVGVISLEDEQPDAFSAEDERLIVTLANQAASAFENARLFEETRQRVVELETLNRISLVLRAVSKQEEMLEIVLDEALVILNTSHGFIELYNKTTGCLDKTIARGWTAQVVEPPKKSGEGISGKVFASGETYISREFASDPETRAISRSQIPPNWGGILLPIRTTQQTLGVMLVSVPSEHELNKDEVRLLSILSEMTGAALQRMRLHEQTVRHLEQLRALRSIDQAIASSLDMHLTLNVLITHAISQLGVDAADILLLHPASNQLDLVASQGFHTTLFENANLSDSVAGRAIMERRPIITLDLESATLHENSQFVKFWKEEGFVCSWCVLLSIKGEVKGVLEIYRRTAFTPDAEWLEFLEALAGQAAIAIDSAQLFENLQRANLDLSLAYDATIEGWSRAMDLRDHETEGHTLRVTDLTLKLARAMRISESQLTAIRRGALLHDIGKIGVPDAILLKEGELTDEEWVLMREHPRFAYDMLSPVAYLNDALNIPYCHHERWDGTGYPQGLKGDRIPLVARIFAIVDVWDALTNDRTYRKKWTKEKARQHIQEQSGKHFDPQVVEIFLKNMEKV